MTRSRIQRFCLLWAIFNLILLFSACTAAWTTEALNIITTLAPAIQAAIAIVVAFGLGISPDVLQKITKWSSEATNALTNVVVPLINEYNAAAADAKPGILGKIEAAIKTITDNLSAILPTIHVTNPAMQAKIYAIINAVLTELLALLNLIPVVQGKVAGHDEVKRLFHALKSPKEFKKDFNSKVDAFGPKAKSHRI